LRVKKKDIQDHCCPVNFFKILATIESERRILIIDALRIRISKIATC